jgi:hypothetical protein
MAVIPPHPRKASPNDPAEIRTGHAPGVTAGLAREVDMMGEILSGCRHGHHGAGNAGPDPERVGGDREAGIDGGRRWESAPVRDP